jgi:hypothetical protein
MKHFAVILLIVILAFSGEWIYRSFLRPIDQLQPEVIALAEHFNKNGMKVTPYAVRHGFRHSDRLASAGFQISNYPLPISIELCPNEEKALELVRIAKVSPNLEYPTRNGNLVMILPMWGDDTKEMATKAQKIFLSFKNE